MLYIFIFLQAFFYTCNKLARNASKHNIFTLQTGYLDVRIPPNILDEADIEGPGSAAMEGGTIRLRCRSTGKPEPKVHWKRKDNRHIVIRSDGAREKQGLCV